MVSTPVGLWHHSTALQRKAKKEQKPSHWFTSRETHRQDWASEPVQAVTEPNRKPTKYQHAYPAV